MKFEFEAKYSTEIVFEPFKNTGKEFIFADEFFKGKFDGERTFYIEGGEEVKSTKYLLKLLEFCESTKIRKNDTIIAIGGGAILDLIGFVSSILHRGVKLIYVPTTLLSMVDSCLGGKTGINTSLGKNTLGAFYPASKIIIDTDFLETLPANEISNAMAEIIKYEFITGQEISGLPKDELIKKCLEIKASFCEDLLDRNKRKFLNYGHTYGHAIETLMPGEYSHGEAVGLGMIFVAKLTGNAELLKITIRKLQEFNLPIELPKLDMKKVFQQMKLDKKNISDKITFVILEKIGQPRLEEFTDEATLNIS